MDKDIDIFLPTLHTFAMKNPFTGSWGMLRFKITPNVVMATAKEVDFEKSTIHVTFWHGLFCFEKSTMEGENTFPMTEEGRSAMKQWLESNI